LHSWNINATLLVLKGSLNKVSLLKNESIYGWILLSAIILLLSCKKYLSETINDNSAPLYGCTQNS